MTIRDARSDSRGARRAFLRTAGRSALVLSAASFAQFDAFFRLPESRAASPPSRTREVSIGIIAPSHCAASYAYAHVKGLFTRQGVQANLHYYQEMPLLARDLIDGRIQVGQLISPLFLSVHLRASKFKKTGVPLVTPMFTGTNGGAVVVAKNSPAMSLSDMGGMTIGSHSKLTVHYLMMMNLIRNRGVKLSEPIKMEILPLKEMIPSLASGRIQGFIMPEPINAVAEAKGVGRVLQLSREVWPDHPCCLLAATRRFADEQRETFTAVSLAVLEAARFAGAPANREAFVDTIRELEPYGKMKKELLLKAFAPGRADFDPFPYRSSATTVASLMQNFMLLPQSLAPSEVEEPFDTDTTRALLAQLGDTAPDDYRQERFLGKSL